MGTRANFFVGNPMTERNYKWLGCVAWDGYEFAEDKSGKYCLGMIVSEDCFRQFVDIVKRERKDFASPDNGGYPFPWVNDIFLTDYSYAFFDDYVWIAIGHRGWVQSGDYEKADFDNCPSLPKIRINLEWDRKQPDSIMIFT